MEGVETILGCFEEKFEEKLEKIILIKNYRFFFLKIFENFHKYNF